MHWQNYEAPLEIARQRNISIGEIIQRLIL